MRLTLPPLAEDNITADAFPADVTAARAVLPAMRDAGSGTLLFTTRRGFDQPSSDVRQREPIETPQNTSSGTE